MSVSDTLAKAIANYPPGPPQHELRRILRVHNEMLRLLKGIQAGVRYAEHEIDSCILDAEADV